MPNLTGQMLGKVRVDMFLARGGMAEVFIGTHTTLQRTVAIKFLKGDLQDEPELRERFEREARVIAMLRHPNIVQVYDFDTHENQPYLIMEYVPGTSLATYLKDLHKNGQRLSLDQVMRLLDKLASALKYAHANGVIHRDIKPANILLSSQTEPVSTGKPLSEDAEPILTDFGLVRFLQSSKQTSTGIITGTPAYMSPEQARGDQTDGRTDVYSLGVTVYEMLAGRVPFEADSTLSVLHQQIFDPPPPIPGISKPLQDVMDRALAKNRDERFQTPTEFAQAFQAAVTGIAEAATLKPTPSNSLLAALTQPRNTQTTATASASSKQPNMLLPIGIAAALLVLAGLIFFMRNGTSAQPEAAMLTSPANTPEKQSTMASPAATEAAVPTSAPVQQQVGLLRFQDGATHADQATFTAMGMPLPPEGSQYQVWLIEDDGEQRVSIGFITKDMVKQGTVTYVDPQGRNLIGRYHALEITVEPDPDSNPIPSGKVAFTTILPRSGFSHVRHLLSNFDGNPNGISFIQGLDADTSMINKNADALLAALQAKDKVALRLSAEQMLNMIVGVQSPDHKDWNGNGKIDDPGDGFGLLLNGDNEGYIQGVISHATLSSSAADATENMLMHGEHVKISAENLSEWTPQLRDKLIAILQSKDDGELEGLVREAVAMANQIRNGVDLNGNENIEPVAGEGGAVTAYQHAYYMADIAIFSGEQVSTSTLMTPATTSTSSYYTP